MTYRSVAYMKGYASGRGYAPVHQYKSRPKQIEFSDGWVDGRMAARLIQEYEQLMEDERNMHFSTKGRILSRVKPPTEKVDQ